MCAGMSRWGLMLSTTGTAGVSDVAEPRVPKAKGSGRRCHKDEEVPNNVNSHERL
jgi:hypothetical protein